MFLGILVAFAVASPGQLVPSGLRRPGPICAILGAALIIVLIGVADDIWDLDWMTKLAGADHRGRAARLAGRADRLACRSAGSPSARPCMSLILTVFAIVLVMNAVNFIDGLDGLVAGVAIIANGVFFVYSYMLGQGDRRSRILQPRLAASRPCSSARASASCRSTGIRRSCSWATPARCWSGC